MKKLPGSSGGKMRKMRLYFHKDSGSFFQNIQPDCKIILAQGVAFFVIVLISWNRIKAASPRKNATGKPNEEDISR